MTQQIVNGVFLGSIYALFALGYTLVFGVLHQLNLAHQAVFMLGAVSGWTVSVTFGLPLWAAVLGALIAGAALGLVIERVAFAPLRARPDDHFAGLISSLALGIILVALALGTFGPDTVRFPREAFPTIGFRIAGASITLLQVAILGFAIAMMVGLTWLVDSTRLGRALRAVAENERAARLMGIDVERVTMGTYMLSSALGATAGILFALAFNTIRVEMGLAIELKGLAVIIVGGLGSLPGAMVGGLILGLAEVGTIALIGSGWRDAVAFTLLFGILLLRPQGLFGKAQVREV